MAAYLINIVLLLLCFFGFAAILQPNAFAFYLRSVTLTEVLNLNFLVSPILFANMYFDMVMGSVLVLILGIVQMVLISIKGQSIGKIIMGIKVVKVTGEQAGFVHAYFLREIGYIFVVFILNRWVFQKVEYSETEWNIEDTVAILENLANLTMLFLVAIERRTLPDFLARTKVMKTK